MPNRSVKVTYEADVNGFIAKTEQASRKVDQFGDTAVKASKRQQEAWDKVGTGMLAAGTVMAAGVGYATKSFMDFDQQMSAVKAALDGTPGQMKAVTEAVREAGKSSVFSSVEAGQAAEELAKAGIKTSDIIGGALTGSMDLAAAGAVGLADAAELSGQAMKIFGLQGQDVTHIADVLTAGANKSAAGVDDLGQALQQGGLVAAQTGLDLEGTVGTLSAFADNALKGSDAGTSLKTMLQRLTPQSKEAAEKMEELGFSAYDAQGNFVGMPELAGRMKDAFGDMAPEARNAALQVVFGSDAVRGANVLMREGKTGIREYIKAVDDQGIAAKTAGTRIDNLAGDVEQFTGALSDVFIEQGSAGNSFFRDTVQGATDVVDAFASMPDGAQHAVFAVGAVSSAALIAGGGLIKLAKWTRDARDTLSDLGITADLTGGKVGSIAKGAGAAAAAIAAISVAGSFVEPMYGRNAAGAHEAAKSLEAYAKSGKDASDVTALQEESFKDLGDTVRYAFQGGVVGGTKEFFAELGLGFGLFGPTGVDRAGNFFEEVDAGLSQMVSSGKRAQAQKIFSQITAEAKKQGISIAEVKDKLPGYSSAMDAAGAASKRTEDATKQITEAMNQAGGQVDQSEPKFDAFGNMLTDTEGKAIDTRTALQNLANSIRGLGNDALATSDAQISFHQAIDAAAKAAKENAHTLNLATEAGQNNRSTLNQLARSGHAVTASMVEEGRSRKDVTKFMKDARDEYYKAALAITGNEKAARRLTREAGFTKENIDKVTDSLKKVPRHTEAHVSAPGAKGAKDDVDGLNDTIGRLHGKTVTVGEKGATAAAGTVRYLGGQIDRLHDKTVTVNVHTVGKFGGGTLRYLQSQQQENGGIVEAFADGGIRLADGARVDRVPQLVDGGANILWGEPATGWEAYISGKPSQRARNEAVLAEAASRLGKVVVSASRQYASPALSHPATVTGAGGGTTYQQPVYIGRMYAQDMADARHQADKTRRREALGQL